MNICGQCGAKIVRVGLCPECLEYDDDDVDEEEEEDDQDADHD